MATPAWVSAARMDLQRGKAPMQYDAAKASEAALKQVVEEAGFEAG